MKGAGVGERGRILVVDDEEGIARMLQVLLESRGFSTLVAHSGRAALELLGSYPVDLVLLDIMMPGFDGHQVLKWIKGRQELRHLPVILVTAKDGLKDKVEGLRLGADDYITKPFNNEELLARIRVQLRISQMGAELRQRNEELSALNAIATAVNQPLDLNRILNDALDKVLEVLEAEGGQIRLVDERTGELVLAVHRGHSPEFVAKKARARWEEHSLAPLREKGGVLILDDLSGVEDPSLQLARAEGYRSYLGIALRSRDRTVGTLCVLSRTLGRFQGQTLPFLTAIGHQVGVAIENARLFEEHSRLAITDELTGLYNHRHFYQVLQAEVSRALRYRRNLSLILLDIDHFKQYNDRFGHLVGDEALRRLAEILKRNTRDVDVVARYGGEEFAIILPETTLQQAAIHAERIRAAVEEHRFRDRFTVSLGVAAFGKGKERGEELVLMADQALYRAKAEGRNRVCLAQSS